MNYHKPNIVDALLALGFSDVAGAVINTEEGYKDLKIYSEKTVPTWAEVSKKLEELQADYDAKQYQRDRIYPDIGEQLDYIFHNGIEKWKTDIVQPIKNKYPKPE